MQVKIVWTTLIFSIFQKQRKIKQIVSKMKNFKCSTIEKYYYISVILILKHF